jgi:hypothetical protein
MEPYSFLADVLSTFRSSSDLVKIVWLLNPSLFVIAVAALLVLGGKALAYGCPGPRQRAAAAGPARGSLTPALIQHFAPRQCIRHLCCKYLNASRVNRHTTIRPPPK